MSSKLKHAIAWVAFLTSYCFVLTTIAFARNNSLFHVSSDTGRDLNVITLPRAPDVAGSALGRFPDIKTSTVEALLRGRGKVRAEHFAVGASDDQIIERR